MNINEEGKYYALMVRKFRTEYNSKNLRGFCKEQKVSYTKMLHCIRDDSCRKSSIKPVAFEGEQGLRHIFLSKDSHQVRIYYFHHQGEILTEKILHGNHFVEPIFDEARGCYHISWESFVYLVEGIVLKDRKVAFDDLDNESDEQTGLNAEDANL